MSLLVVNNISMQFGGLVAVDDFSFHVNENEIVSIIGPNGAGKTTVFNMLTGVYRIDSGEIFFDGIPIHDKTPQEIVRLGIARTFQNIRLFPNMRVIENVMVGQHTTYGYTLFDSVFRTKRFREEEAEKVAEAVKILDMIGFKGKYSEYAGNLPYGEQRRLEIARAIATNARLLLLDEPAAGMNPQESEDLLQFIKEVRDIGYTVLLIEHDMSVVMNISDRIYVLDHGKEIANGIPDLIANDKNVIRSYLGGELDDA